MSAVSDHISYKEATKSNTAIRYGIRNNPNKNQLYYMRQIAENVFEPLREWVGGPVRVNSFFRSLKLNKKVGGSSTSQHVKGQAIDIDDSYGFKTNAEMFHYIRENLDYDQLIWEFGDDKNPDWIHVSYRPGNNRSIILKATRVKFINRAGKEKFKTKYERLHYAL